MREDRQSVLIVDDTPANLRLLASILSEKHYMARPVPNGELALSAARAEPPDLILLDIMMPDLSGYEVCERLKREADTRDIPVIFLSAKTDVDDKVKAFSVGGVDYITKPFQAEEVIARVETHLNLRRLRTELEAKNRSLSEAMEQLRETQDQLIHREKMAALGQLIAGVAHEINTPLGAVRASIANVTNAVQRFIDGLPRLFDDLAPQRRDDFLALVHAAMEDRERLSSREARSARRSLSARLSDRGVADAETVADALVSMGLAGEADRFLPLLKSPDCRFVLKAAHDLYIQQNNGRNIETAVERAAKVVFALKRYSHFDPSGKKIRANIPEGIDVVLTLYHNHLKRGIEVNTDYRDVPEIFCYPDELNQVWTNLVHNAIQAMDGKGRLDIRIEKTETAIRVRFADTGPGIPEAIMNRIFDPFFTTKAAGEGSGLGLNIVRRIVDRHDGEIHVENRPDGAAFTITLPLTDIRPLRPYEKNDEEKPPCPEKPSCASTTRK